MTQSAPERLELPSSTVSNCSDCEVFWRFTTNTALKQDKVNCVDLSWYKIEYLECCGFVKTEYTAKEKAQSKPIFFCKIMKFCPAKAEKMVKYFGLRLRWTAEKN